MNSQLDAQNQELQREINDYKRTIFNLEADASKQKQKSEDDINMLRQQLREKEREHQTDINQVEAEHTQRAKKLERENKKTLK